MSTSTAALPAPMTFREVLGFTVMRRVWFAQVISLIGDFLAVFAVISVVTYRMHGTPQQVTGVQIAYMLPLALLGPLSGVFVDRWPLKPTLIASDLIRAGLVLLLFATTSMWQIYLVLGALSWPVLRVLFRLRASGVENVPRAGGCVLAANHNSNLDPWPLGIPLYPHRFLRFMGKSELFWFPLSLLLRGGGAFKVRRGQRDEEAIATAVSLARAGHVVVMFPEGTRRSKGLIKRHEARWRSGAARIALEAGVPLVPAGIVGTDRLVRFAALRVAYGPAIALDDLDLEDPAAAALVATDRLRVAVEVLEASLR